MKTIKPPEPSEYEMQRHIFRWADALFVNYPELQLLNGSANGAWFPITLGRMKWRIINMLKATGCLKKGFPDINLPVARGDYHGLYIELKKKDNKPTDDQQRWISRLRDQGYCVAVCHGAEIAKMLILKYIEGK